MTVDRAAVQVSLHFATAVSPVRQPWVTDSIATTTQSENDAVYR